MPEQPSTVAVESELHRHGRAAARLAQRRRAKMRWLRNLWGSGESQFDLLDLSAALRLSLAACPLRRRLHLLLGTQVRLDRHFRDCQSDDPPAHTARQALLQPAGGLAAAAASCWVAAARRFSLGRRILRSKCQPATSRPACSTAVSSCTQSRGLTLLTLPAEACLAGVCGVPACHSCRS